MKRPLSPSLPQGPNFPSFFAGGFECSTHRRRSGKRLDLIASTAHDRFAVQDYQRLQREGLRVAREGVRWHLVEASAGKYDFSSVAPIVRAARATHTKVVWDLCHFGWPDHLDLFQPDFVSSLTNYGAAFVRWLARETDDVPYIVPINEISYFSWAAGDEGSMYPFVTGRGFELKAHLVRAVIQTMEAIWAISAQARFLHVDPVIHVVASPRHPEEQMAASAYSLSQYQSFDMLSGRVWPELGGQERYLDLIGLNFYPYNQWFYNLKGTRRIRKFEPIRRRHPLYRPFREILAEVYGRYHKPLFIAETGAENAARPGWFRYVCQEVEAAQAEGVPVDGICLYPILNHPGWIDDRHVHTGLWDYPDAEGHRAIYVPLARELRRWRKHFESAPAVTLKAFAAG